MDQPSSTEDSGITLRIKFKSETVEQFIARYGSDVSPGGIFIRTREPLGVGTNLRFEFSLADTQPLLIGQGTVVWVREPDQARAGVVPGMGVRFDKLTAHSQAVLGNILAGKARRDRVDPAPESTGNGRATPSAGSPVPAAAAPERPRPSAPMAPAARVPSIEVAEQRPDPWQADRTEIASFPPAFSAEGPRRTEAPAMASAMHTDHTDDESEISAREAAPPARRSTASFAVQHPGAPLRPSAPPLEVALREEAPPDLRPPAPSGSVAPLNGPRQSGSVPALAPMVSRSSASFPSLSSAPETHGDALASSTMNLPVPGRLRAYLVIALVAVLAAASGFLFMQNRLNNRGPVAVAVDRAPAPAPAPTRPAAPSPPPAAEPGAAQEKPALAARPPAVAAAPAATPPPASPPPASPPAAAAPSPAAALPPPVKPATARPQRPRPMHRSAVVARAGAGDQPASSTPDPFAGDTAPAAAADDATASGGEEVYWLKVNSTPRGAEVLIDGQLEGRTPFLRRIFDTTRPYAITVRKAGFDPHDQMLSASDDWVKKGSVHTLTINAKLPRGKPGSQPIPVETDAEKPETDKGAETAPSTEPPPVTPPATQP